MNPPPQIARGGPPASFAAIIAQVTPAVVSIDVEVSPTAFPPRAQSSPPPRGEARPFFMPPRRPPPTRATGSGFFISADGLVLTNNHVVEDATRITVRTGDGRKLDARPIGRDPETDLAILKVAGRGYPYIDLTRSAQPRVGDWVVAVGSPFNLGGTATAGIVSALVRPRIGGSSYVDYMQIDAAINRGNSGGPTFDTAGRLVGVNTAIFSPTGGSVGIGFDIPAAVAADVAQELIAKGRVTRGYLAATVQNVTREIAESLGLDAPAGALIAEVTPDGPAARSGLRPGDLVTQFDGEAVRSATDLTRRIARARPGDSVRLVVRRHGADMDLIVRAGERPAPAVPAGGAASRAATDLGLALTPNPAGGLRVTAVAPGSDVQAKGVRPGDVIEAIGDRRVDTAEDLAEAIAVARAQGRENVLMMVSRNGRRSFLPVDVPREVG